MKKQTQAIVTISLFLLIGFSYELNDNINNLETKKHYKEQKKEVIENLEESDDLWIETEERMRNQSIDS